ncbi:hypothetical protein GOP47_0030108 [Adiantum capillus-veneris]|nr:hypothetical protein GOP47_0030108 [Adiantum capillus-veneris]
MHAVRGAKPRQRSTSGIRQSAPHNLEEERIVLNDAQRSTSRIPQSSATPHNLEEERKDTVCSRDFRVWWACASEHILQSNTKAHSAIKGLRKTMVQATWLGNAFYFSETHVILFTSRDLTLFACEALMKCNNLDAIRSLFVSIGLLIQSVLVLKSCIGTRSTKGDIRFSKEVQA